MSPYTFLTKVRQFEREYYRQIRDFGVWSPQLHQHRKGEKDAYEYLRWLAEKSTRYKYDVDFSAMAKEVGELEMNQYPSAKGARAKKSRTASGANLLGAILPQQQLLLLSNP